MECLGVWRLEVEANLISFTTAKVKQNGVEINVHHAAEQDQISTKKMKQTP